VRATSAQASCAQLTWICGWSSRLSEIYCTLDCIHKSLIFISPTTDCLQESVCQSQWTKNLTIEWFLFLTGKNKVPEIREIIYHCIICELLSQCYGGWKSLEEHVQLGLLYCYKWYNVLLVGYCQKSIRSIQHPIMVIHCHM
jgi:hypothetical protein